MDSRRRSEVAFYVAVLGCIANVVLFVRGQSRMAAGTEYSAVSGPVSGSVSEVRGEFSGFIRVSAIYRFWLVTV